MYTRRMIQRYGLNKVDDMIYDKKPYKITTPELREKIEYYTIKVEELKKKLIK